MQGLELEIRLDPKDGTYRPGDAVRGAVVVRAERPAACEKLVVRRLWRAHGKGNREEGRPSIHDLFHGEWDPGVHRYPFEFTLPNGPATYHGHLLHVGWFLDAVAEIPLAIDARAEVELPLRPGPSEGYFFGPAHCPPPEGPAEGVSGDGPRAVLGAALAAVGLAGIVAWMPIGLAGWPEALGGAIFLLLGGGLALPVIRRMAAERRLGTPDVRIDGTLAHPGGCVDVRVTLTPPVPVTMDGMQADLVAREEVVHGIDSDRTVERREIQRWTASRDRARRAIEPGESFTIEERILIPPDAPLTFAARENRLDWSVEVTIAISGWADWKSTFPVVVGPATALAAAGIVAIAEPLQSRS